MDVENLNLNHRRLEQNSISLIYGTDDIPQLLTAEGYLSDGELGFVIKIMEHEYLNQGLGYQIFNLIVEHFGLENINTICGSWHSDAEFAYFENEMSTNLLVYRRNLEHFPAEEAAFRTPTGKWARRLGFNEIYFRENNLNSVVVEFSR